MVIVSKFLEIIHKNKPEDTFFSDIFDQCMVLYTVFNRYFPEDGLNITIDSKKAVNGYTCTFTCSPTKDTPYDYMATVYNDLVFRLYGSDFTTKTKLQKDGTVIIKVIRM